MSQTARTRFPREMRIAETLIAARAVFEKQGYAETAMSQIASKVGVVEGALYRFFSSKAELLMAVACDWYKEISVPLKDGLPLQKTMQERLHFVIWHHLMCIQTSPELVNLFYNVARNDKQYVNSELFKINRWYVGLVADILNEGIASG
jgi:AcrR family transcriptional regulator